MVVTLEEWFPPQWWVSSCESYRGHYRCVVTCALGPVMVGKQMYNGNAFTLVQLMLRCCSAARQLITTLLLALLSLWDVTTQFDTTNLQWRTVVFRKIVTASDHSVTTLQLSWGPLQHELSLPACVYLPHTLHTLSTKSSSPYWSPEQHPPLQSRSHLTVTVSQRCQSVLSQVLTSLTWLAQTVWTGQCFKHFLGRWGHN